MPNRPTDDKDLNLGFKLKLLRGNVSRSLFAEYMGIDLETYIKYEDGELCVPNGLIKLAKKLNQEHSKEVSDTKKYPYAELGLKLKNYRGSLTKKAYSDLLGVAYRTYIRYEKGERKLPDGLLNLAEMLREKEEERQKRNSDQYIIFPKSKKFDEIDKDVAINGIINIFDTYSYIIDKMSEEFGYIQAVKIEDLENHKEVKIAKRNIESALKHLQLNIELLFVRNK